MTEEMEISMKQRMPFPPIYTLILLQTLMALIIPRTGLAQGTGYVPGEVIVRYGAGVAAQQIQAIETRFDLTVLSELPHLRLRHYKLPEGVTVPVAIEQLSAIPEVESVDPNVIYRLQGIPSDPLFGEQWGLHNTGQTVQGINGSADADIDWPEAMDLFSPSDYGDGGRDRLGCCARPPGDHLERLGQSG